MKGSHIFIVSLLAFTTFAIKIILQSQCILALSIRHQFKVWTVAIVNFLILGYISGSYNSEPITIKTVSYVWIAAVIKH